MTDRSALKDKERDVVTDPREKTQLSHLGSTILKNRVFPVHFALLTSRLIDIDSTSPNVERTVSTKDASCDNGKFVIATTTSLFVFEALSHPYRQWSLMLSSTKEKGRDTDEGDNSPSGAHVKTSSFPSGEDNDGTSNSRTNPQCC
jgi:hypothetical protein